LKCEGIRRRRECGALREAELLERALAHAHAEARRIAQREQTVGLYPRVVDKLVLERRLVRLSKSSVSAFGEIARKCRLAAVFSALLQLCAL
jgi:hypothetical protein